MAPALLETVIVDDDHIILGRYPRRGDILTSVLMKDIGKFYRISFSTQIAFPEIQ